jgi:predicted 2-oxoglutarate/Fe(II)-dependent dioxygenase YbiX|tara:strand:+ start:1513 stop:2061 length:549 start_codon:yes stop_codon:yes gene_type:complete
MDHTEAIVELKNVINLDLTKKLISLTDKKATKKLTIDYDLDNVNVRNVDGYSLNFNTPTNLFYWNLIKKEIERLYVFYKSKFPGITTRKINQIDLLKYSEGGKYETHTDYFQTALRTLSIIINLNNDYEGGDLVFVDQKEKEIKRLKLGEGSIVFFPSNFLYPHMIEPIKKGKRYSIVAWLQ